MTLRPPTGTRIWRCAWMPTVATKGQLVGSGGLCIDFDTEDEAEEHAAGLKGVVYSLLVEPLPEPVPVPVSVPVGGVVEDERAGRSRRTFEGLRAAFGGAA